MPVLSSGKLYTESSPAHTSYQTTLGHSNSQRATKSSGLCVGSSALWHSCLNSYVYTYGLVQLCVLALHKQECCYMACNVSSALRHCCSAHSHKVQTRVVVYRLYIMISMVLDALINYIHRYCSSQSVLMLPLLNALCPY
jgi:hypothetical protein